MLTKFAAMSQEPLMPMLCQTYHWFLYLQMQPSLPWDHKRIDGISWIITDKVQAIPTQKEEQTEGRLAPTVRVKTINFEKYQVLQRLT